MRVDRRGVVLLCALFAAGCGGESGAGEVAEEIAASSDALEGGGWARVAASRGASPARGALVVGVRGRDVADTHHETRVTRSYDDALVVLANGEATIFPASTHPFEQRSSSVPDVDGDGRRDVGMIRPGVYRAALREPSRNIGGAPTFHVLPMSGGGDRIPAWRNTNQDDRYSDDERRASEARGDVQTAILFHQGEDAPPAVGCQVLPAAHMAAFARLVGREFTYVLVDDAPDLPAFR